MSSLDKAWEKKVAELLTGKVASLNRPAANLWIALTTTVPTRVANGAAATYTGYARFEIEAAKLNITEGTASEPTLVKNAEEVKSPECTGGESTIKGIELWTAESGGERVAWGVPTEELTVTPTHMPYVFAAEALVWQFN